MVLKFADGAVKAAVGVLGVLEKGGPSVGDLVIFVYTHGHMGRGLVLIRRHDQRPISLRTLKTPYVS